MVVQWWLFWAAAVVAATVVDGENVTYDGRSLIIDGERKLLFSGSIHYPRSTPEMWPDLIAKAKEGGLDVIQTYVFWNLHEPQPGQYDFSGRYDLVSFIKQVQAQGLYVCLRIGPFVEAEWNYGGFPFWLHDVPGITYRTDNEPFKFYMQNFTTKIVNMMKSEGLYAPQGGPIILSQVENEYENVERAFGDEGHSYVLWAAKMAVDLGTGVPWVMCKQQDAPDPVINTCNGLRCGETFLGPNSPDKPALWTENWTSFYQAWGTPPVIRSPEDIAFHTTLFIAKNNGSYINYYMYHGGTNFGRTTSNYFITGYYDQAPLDEYGLLRQPKYGHLKDLHAAIKSCSAILLQGNQTNITLGPLQEAYVFQEEQGGCVAFLINNGSADATLQFRSLSFDLPPKSISILQDCTVEIFNTAKVNTGPNKRVTTTVQTFDSADEWEEFTDVVPNFTDTLLRSNTLLEHTNTTKDETDYLWYTFSFQPNSSCTEPILHIQTQAHVVRAFTNNIYIGAAHGDRRTKEFTLENPIVLEDGMNNVSILSAMVGLLDSGAHLESKTAGLTEVQIQCTQESYNFTTDYAWGYQVGLVGEQLHIYDEENQDKVNWSKLGSSTNQTLTWYKTVFDAPLGDDPIVLSLSTMGKGEAWVNGQSIGRYWISFHTSKGDSSQTLYHVPRSFLKPIRNLLVLFEEEEGGEPLQISLNTIATISSNEHTSRLNL